MASKSTARRRREPMFSCCSRRRSASRTSPGPGRRSRGESDGDASTQETAMKRAAIGCALSITAVLMAESAVAASCEGLASLTLKNATVTAAQRVAGGVFAPPVAAPAQGARGTSFKDLPEFCRVALTLTPSTDSDIKVEVWLPANGWNGKFQAVGNGGWAGVISYAAMADAIRAGYATSSTDTGHAGG